MNSKSSPSGALRFATAMAVLVLSGCAQNGGVDGFVQKANAAVASAIGGVTGSQASEPYYQPISGGEQLKGIFAKDDQQKARYAGIAWPRVAVTVNTYGANQPCWTFTATIWSSASKSHDERFRLCDNAAINVTDDLGNTRTTSIDSLSDFSMAMDANMVQRVQNTGSTRTRGPVPPVNPWNVQINANASTPFGTVDPFVARWTHMKALLGYLTAFPARYDYRFWLYRFDPAGKQA